MGFTIRRIGEESRGSRVKKQLLKALGVGIMITRPLVQLTAAIRQNQAEDAQAARRQMLLKRIGIVLLAVLGGVVTIVVLLRILIALNLISAQSLLSVSASPLPTDQLGHTNILLMGQGDETHDGIDLTDTIMLASIDPDDGSAVLLSLPRDLYLYNLPGVQGGRINELYRNRKGLLQHKGMAEADASREAMKETATIIGLLLGMQVHHVIKVDFTAFVEGVDALGGVTVDVPYSIVDNEYPADTGFGYAPFVITQGTHHLDGETALKYARSRHTTSDFGRSARQQQLIAALNEAMKEAGILSHPSKILELLSIAGKHVETTMSFGEIAGLAAMGKALERDRIVTMQLNDQNGLYGSQPEAGGLLYSPPRDQFNGASVLLPVSVPEFPITWKQIRTFSRLLAEHRDVYLPPMEVEIRNVSAPPGSAQKITWELLRYGINVTTAKNAPKDLRDKGLAQTHVFLPSGSTNGKALADLLGLPSSVDEASLIPDTSPGSIKILLGEDYVFSALQDLLPSPLP